MAAKNAGMYGGKGSAGGGGKRGGSRTGGIKKASKPKLGRSAMKQRSQ